MGLLENYREQNPEAFREAPKWEPPREYGFFIRLVMRLSGGKIRDVNTAAKMLAIAAAVVFVVSLFLFFSGGGGPKLPPEREILRDTPTTGVRQGAEIPR